MRWYKSAALTANQVTANLVSGIGGVEWTEYPAMYRLSATQSLTTGGVLITILAGGRKILDEIAVGGANRSPVFPDDVVKEFAVMPGEQVILRIRESLGGTPTYFVQLDVVPA